MKKIFTYIFSMFFLHSIANETVLHGHIINAETQEHVPYISISIKGSTIGTSTDVSGHYEIKCPATGKHTITAQGMGFIPTEKEIEITKGGKTEVNFEIHEDLVQLNEIVVSGSRHETSRKESPVVVGVISPKLFEITNSTCLAQGLNFQPGLRLESNCQNCGFQQVRINGLEGPYSQMLIDGHPVFSALNSVYGIEQIPVSMIERVEVVRGGGSALYGSNAIAGTINIITKEAQNNSYAVSNNYERIDGKTSDLSLNVHTSIVSNDKKNGLYLYGSYRNRDSYDNDNDGYSDIPLLKNNALGFRSFYRLSTQSKLSVEYHNLHEFRRGGNAFDLQPHQSDVTEQAEHDIHGGSIGYDWLSPDEHNKISIYTSLQHTNRDSYYGAGRDTAAYGKTKDMTSIFGSQYTHHFDQMLFLPADFTAGGEFQCDDLKDKQPAYDRNLKQTTKVGGLFLQNEWKTATFSLLIGGRLDKHNLLHKIIVSPRGNIKYNLSEHLYWRGSYSTGFRAPQAFDEDLHIEAVNGNVQLIQLANDLQAEHSYSYSTSLDWYLTIGNIKTNFLMEGFHTTIDQVFVLKKIGEDTNGNSVLERQNGSGATVMGINLEGKIVPTDKTRLQFGLTFQKSDYAKPEAWSDDKSVATTTRMLRSPHQYGYFTLTLEPRKRLEVSITGNYTGSMIVPHFSGYIANDQLKRTSTFFDAGLKAAYCFLFHDGFGLQLSGGIKNLFNSYQKDFDKGPDRDAGYVYGPSLPQTFFLSLKISNLF